MLVEVKTRSEVMIASALRAVSRTRRDPPRRLAEEVTTHGVGAPQSAGHSRWLSTGWHVPPPQRGHAGLHVMIVGLPAACIQSSPDRRSRRGHRHHVRRATLRQMPPQSPHSRSERSTYLRSPCGRRGLRTARCCRARHRRPARDARARSDSLRRGHAVDSYRNDMTRSGQRTDEQSPFAFS